MWERSNASRDQLLVQLQDWCHRAGAEQHQSAAGYHDATAPVMLDREKLPLEFRYVTRPRVGGVFTWGRGKCSMTRCAGRGGRAEARRSWISGRSGPSKSTGRRRRARPAGSDRRGRRCPTCVVGRTKSGAEGAASARCSSARRPCSWPTTMSTPNCRSWPTRPAAAWPIRWKWRASGCDHTAQTLVVAGRAFHGRDGQNSEPGQARSDAGPRRNLLAGPRLPGGRILALSATPIRTARWWSMPTPSAAVKARADWMVTSSIGLEIVADLHARGEKIMWAPDRAPGRLHPEQDRRGHADVAGLVSRARRDSRASNSICCAPNIPARKCWCIPSRRPTWWRWPMWSAPPRS